MAFHQKLAQTTTHCFTFGPERIVVRWWTPPQKRDIQQASPGPQERHSNNDINIRIEVSHSVFLVWKGSSPYLPVLRGSGSLSLNQVTVGGGTASIGHCSRTTSPVVATTECSSPEIRVMPASTKFQHQKQLSVDVHLVSHRNTIKLCFLFLQWNIKLAPYSAQTGCILQQEYDPGFPLLSEKFFPWLFQKLCPFSRPF